MADRGVGGLGDRTAYDVAVIGGGIVGLATARSLLALRPRLRLILIEKEAAVGRHQTGHNSGVLHMGLYYRPGSLKARMAVGGAEMMRTFCRERDIPLDAVGKVVVASDEAQRPALEELLRRGTENGVPDLRLIEPDELRALEPHAAGVAALHSPHTSILNYGDVASAIAAELWENRAEIRLGARLIGGVVTSGGAILRTSVGTLEAGVVVNCAGLYADIVARLLGAEIALQIVTFRGEYYALRPDRCGLVRGLIYPVPDPRFPFLGVHFTRKVDGGVEAGPNAVPALGREGYSWRDVAPVEILATMRFPGAYRLARRYWRTGVYEVYRSLRKAEFARSLQRLVPEVREEDLIPGGAGVRAQAIDREGRLLDDFEIVRQGCAVHVLNAPSPAATACFAIGEHIAALA